MDEGKEAQSAYVIDHLDEAIEAGWEQRWAPPAWSLRYPAIFSRTSDMKSCSSSDGAPSARRM